MDTSIRLQHIFGDIESVRIQKVPPMLGARMVLGVLDACRPYMRYVRGFVSFSEHVYHGRSENGLLRTTDATSKLCTFDDSTRCAYLAGPKIKYLDGGRVYRQHILVSQNGDVLLWDWYARYKRHRGERMEVAIRSKVCELRGRRLQRYLEANWHAALTSLGWLVTDTIEERARRLASMQQLNDFIKAVEGRLIIG